MSIETLAYSPRHKEAVIELILGIQQKEFEIPIDLAAQPDLQRIPEFYQQGKGNFWVALQGEKVVGTIGLKDIGSNNVALRKMFVGAAYRGRQWGTGQALLNCATGWAKGHQLDNIYLGTTEKFLAAQRFYEKNGFVEIEKQQLPASFPVMGVDSKFYRLALAPGEGL